MRSNSSILPSDSLRDSSIFPRRRRFSKMFSAGGQVPTQMEAPASAIALAMANPNPPSSATPATSARLPDARRARVTFPAGLAGSLCGAALVLLVPPSTLRPLVLVLLVAVAVALALRPSTATPTATPTSTPTSPSTWARRAPRLAAAAVALVLGAYDGFFGPGSGTFLILAFAFLFDLPLQRASADAKPVNFASNLAALALFSARGAVLWEVALPMAAAQFAGGWLGAHLAVRGGDRLVRAVVLLVVLALVSKLAADMLRASG